MSLPVLHKNVTVLAVPDARVVAELRALLPLDAYVIGEISPTELVIDPARVGELAARLQEKGLAALIKKERSAEEPRARWAEEPTAPLLRR
jgi:hypothetical protein